MSESDEAVRHAARLARLEVSAAEVERLGRDFTKILGAFAGLAALDVEGVEPSTGSAGLPTRLREDQVTASLGAEGVLANAPDPDDRFFGVPKTLDT